MKEQFLNKQLSVRINPSGQADFEKLREWLGVNNLFLEDGTPANKINYPGPATIVVFITKEGFVDWAPLIQNPNEYKIVESRDFLAQEVIDADVEVVNEVSNIDLNISITEVVPATITSNIKELKEVTIPKIKQYAKTVVTADNYKEIDTMLTNLRKAKETLNKGKITTKKEASKTIVEFEADVKEILVTFDDVIGHLAEQTNAFKEAEKEKRRKELEDTISKLKNVLIENNMISKEYADKFVFDEKWLNKSTTQKAFKEAVEKQFNELIEQEKKDKEVLNAIVGTINAQNVPDGLMTKEKYIQLYQTGTSLPEVLKLITEDGIKTRESIENEKKKAVEDARETIVQETVQNIEKSTAIIKEDTTTNHVDDKTGEVIAKSDDDKIIMKIQENKNPDKTYKYIYEFEGNFSAIKTFSNFLKVLSKINKTFKFERK